MKLGIKETTTGARDTLPGSQDELALGVHLTDATIMELDQEISRVTAEITRTADEFSAVRTKLGALTADKHIQKAKAIIRVWENEWSEEKLTMDVRGAKAIQDEKYEQVIQDYYITEATFEAAQGKLRALEKVLSGLQTRARLLGLEVNMSGHQ